jgi:uncharacterized protein (TIGR03435 family)
MRVYQKKCLRMQKFHVKSENNRDRFRRTARFTALMIPVFASTLVSPSIRAQSQPTTNDRPSFAVATVKENKSDRPGSMNIPLLGDIYTPTGGVFSGTNIPLISYIYLAYNFTGNQMQLLVPHLPGWVITTHFDIEARAEGNPTKSQMRLMVQSLLVDRFKMAAHYETQQLPVYAAVLSKSEKTGPQLRPHSEDVPCSTVPPPPPTPGSASTPATIVGGLPTVCGGIVALPETAPGRMRVGGRNIPIGMIISTLAQMGGFDRSVIDQTGLTGNFDFSIEWTPQRRGPDADPPLDDSGPQLMQALNEQLGLKLESKKGPVEVFILDHIERPSPN